MQPESNQSLRSPNSLTIRKETGVDIVDIESNGKEGYVHGNILHLPDRTIALVMDIFVKHESRNTGIGQSLLDEFISYSISHGATQICAAVVSESGMKRMLETLERHNCVIIEPKDYKQAASTNTSPTNIVALLATS